MASAGFSPTALRPFRVLGGSLLLRHLLFVPGSGQTVNRQDDEDDPEGKDAVGDDFGLRHEGDDGKRGE